MVVDGSNRSRCNRRQKFSRKLEVRRAAYADLQMRRDALAVLRRHIAVEVRPELADTRSTPGTCPPAGSCLTGAGGGDGVRVGVRDSSFDEPAVASGDSSVLNPASTA